MAITDNHNPWRDALRPASFRGVEFHVDVGAKSSGRRIVLHEFPKKDLPYAEDMGRRAKELSISAYLIGPNYKDDREDLVRALEEEGAATLVHPTMGDLEVVCPRYSVQERRERGGFCEFEMTFVEAGKAPIDIEATQAKVTEKADALAAAALSEVNAALVA